MSEWISQCDGCRSPIRVSVPPAQRQTMPLYCERCFEQMPDEGEPPPPRTAPGQPAVPMKIPAHFTGFIEDEPIKPVTETRNANKQVSETNETNTFTCPTCEGTGRVKMGVG